MAEKRARKYVSNNAQLMAEWDWEENNKIGLSPDTLTCGSGRIAWWKCKKGHKWQTKIVNKSYGYECPYCSGKKVLKGYNDLQTVNPALAKEWNYEKNDGLSPMDVMPNSDRKVWWKRDKGHEWQATIGHRNDGTGCPYCSGRYAVKGTNDLQAVNPTLAKEWDFEKNENLKPENFTAGSGKKVWWKCKNGHEWQASIDSRNRGRGCPYCAGKRVIKGHNDLQTINPALAKEWNFEKNHGLSPMDVLPNCGKKVWWKCTEGHEWQATINDRNRGRGCPYCAGRKNNIPLSPPKRRKN